eukprot:gene9382-10370_t
MFQRPRNWISEVVWKPKAAHSLEKLKYLHFILTKNSVVNENNKHLLVETLRSIAEILIWGDQNDSSVFDFFLEKNMLLFFLKIMTQKCGTYVTVQLLQTLNILFENIRHETSLYFLLSNNHVNSIIVHKFDFSNEEVLAYYISFLKTLSLKLNKHTVNFYFNEQKNDFPLYTEGIKFFNHPESMVRIAVRTLTLNVYRVGHENMLNFICDKTANPYFSNLVWFIGKHAIELDDCVMIESDHLKCDRLKMWVADHLDHLHYLHDILCLEIDKLNMILTDHLLNRLLIPLYVYSLPSQVENSAKHERVCIGRLVSLFLLSQILLIMDHEPLISCLVNVILHDEEEATSTCDSRGSPASLRKTPGSAKGTPGIRAFIPPPDSLESQLEASGIIIDNYNLIQKLESISKDRRKKNSTFYVTDDDRQRLKRREREKADQQQDSSADEDISSSKDTNSLQNQSGSETGSERSFPMLQMDEKNQTAVSPDSQSMICAMPEATSEEIQSQMTLLSVTSIFSLIFQNLHSQINSGVFLKSIYSTFDCTRGDSEALFAISFFYALLNNKGIDRSILEHAKISLPEVCDDYSDELMEHLISILEQGARDGSKVRLVTLEMAITVLKLLAVKDNQSRLKDFHFAMIENAREASTFQLRNFYRADEIFLEMFECEYHQVKNKPINVQYVMMDSSLLLPPTNTPLTGIEFKNRLPCGEEERARRAIRVFLLLRDLCLLIRNEREIYLPLNKIENPVNQDDVLDLNNSDLIACTVVSTNRQHLRRFLVIDSTQFMLVEPDTSKLGWGVVKFIALLQDVEATADKDDSRSLSITVHRPFAARNRSLVNPLPLLSAKFIFDDYIRCMSARQRLQRRGAALRHRKMSTLASLLELPVMAAPPAHFYSLAPYNNNAAQQGYVWAPSSRTYASRSEANLSDKSSPTTSDRQTPPVRTSSERTLMLSPQHAKILEKKNEFDRTTETSDQVDGGNFASMSPDRYERPIKLDTPRPKNEKLQISQAESLASALGSRFGTEELVAQEENSETGVARKLTIDEGEEASEECTDDDMFYDCKNQTTARKDSRVSASHADLLEDMHARTINFDSKTCISAPSTPTGARRDALSTDLRRKLTIEMVNEARSMPAIALNPEEMHLERKKQSQRQKTPKEPPRNSQKSKPMQPSRSNRSARKKQ